MKKILFLLLFSVTAWSQNKAVTDSITYYQEKEDVIKALTYAKKKADNYLGQKNYNMYCETVIRKVGFYLKLNDYERSSQELFQAYKLIEKEPSLLYEKAALLRKIGGVYLNSGNVPKSIYYYKKGCEIAKKTKNDTLVANFYNSLAACSFTESNLKTLFYYLKKSEPIFKVQGTNLQKSKLYTNYFAYYNTIGEFEKSKKYLDSSFVYAKLAKDKLQIQKLYNNYGVYYTKVEKNQKKAEATYLENLRSFGNDTLNENVANCYLNLSYIYEQMKDYKTANVYLSKYLDNSILLSNIAINRQINGIESLYKINKAEEEFKVEKQKLKEAQQKRQLIFLIIIIILILLIVIIAIFYQNSKLKQKNKLNEIENGLKENLLNATIDGRESERKNVATVLHDNISALLSSAGLQLMAFSATQPVKSEEISKARGIIKEAHDKVRDLSHQLVPTLLAKFGLIYALQDLCEKNSNSLITIKFSSTIKSKNHFEGDYEMKLYFIVSEILNNVLKHSKATSAEIIVNESDNILSIIVIDNGQGFTISKNKSNEGFGLTQIRARINALKGKFIIESKPNEGTTVTIQVPIIEKPSTAVA